MRTIFKTRFVSTAVRKESRRDSKTVSEIVAENREQQRKMEVDSDYEFNAPKYIDFLSNEAENEYIDTWFGKFFVIYFLNNPRSSTGPSPHGVYVKSNFVNDL